MFGIRTGAARSLIDMQTGGAKAVGKTGAVRSGEGNGAVSNSWKPAETWHPKTLGNASESTKVCACSSSSEHAGDTCGKRERQAAN